MENAHTLIGMKDMKKIENFTEEINLILKHLQRVERLYCEIYKEYEGNDFEEQNVYASEIENSILTLTHEIGTHLEFEKNRLLKLLTFIDFRKKYKNYSDKDLEKIIDRYNELNITERKKLKKGGNINLLISEWNKTFHNKEYIKFKKSLGI